MLDQIETCYRQYTPPQIAQNQPKPKKQRRRRTS
jgi:hypothetical protein